MLKTTLSLALHSIKFRKFTLVLLLASITLSLSLLVIIDRVRLDTRTSFTQTLSDTELIVGARTGSLNLLLYSVFRLGNATNNISWQSYQELSQRPEIDWSIPLSLGDSHQGYRVLGTSEDYFTHYRYGRSQALTLNQGDSFNEPFDVVLGAHVAKALNYSIGDDIIISHGLGNSALGQHEQHPMKISGILAPTGTAVDKTVHVTLDALEAVHAGYNPVSFSAKGGKSRAPITAFLLGLESPRQIFSMQRFVNEYRAEPLMAVIPGIALQELWQIMSIAEMALLGVSFVVIIVSTLGMVAMLLAGMNERRREMAILRSMGARPWQIFSLLMCESGLIGLASIFGALLLSSALILTLSANLQQGFGISLIIDWPSPLTLYSLFGFLIIAILSGAIPGWLAYRNSLHDGLQIRN